MAISAKNRAYLRSLGVKIKPSLNLGKSEIDDSFLSALLKALKAHELVKVRVLDNSSESIEDIASICVAEAEANVVAITGKTILLYKRNEKNPRISLPKDE